MRSDTPTGSPAPKVSIVLPNYNYARYLDERIQSLLDQTFTDFELIILDDASKDDSLKVIAKYADPRIRTRFFTKNSGLVYKRWNDGADMARGQYIIFAGADDSSHPTMLARLVKALDDNPRVGFAYTQVNITDAAGQNAYVRKDWHDDAHWKADYVNDGRAEARDHLYLRNTVPTASSVLMRRALFERLGQFDTSLLLSADWILWAKFMRVSDVAFIADPLVNFRQHAGAVRYNPTKALKYIAEDFGVTSYIARAFDLPAEKREQIAEITCWLWVDALFKAGLKPGMAEWGRLFRRAYAQAIRLDPRIAKRLAGEVFKKWRRQLRESAGNARAAAGCATPAIRRAA